MVRREGSRGIGRDFAEPVFGVLGSQIRKISIIGIAICGYASPLAYSQIVEILRHLRNLGC